MEWQKWAIIIGAIVAGIVPFYAVTDYQATIGGVLVLIGALVK